MKAYIIKQGDYLMKIAHALDVEAESIWNAPRNMDLKASRDPNVLSPGDILFVPDAALKTSLLLVKGTSNKYVAKIPMTSVRLVFNDADGRPLAEEPYIIYGFGAPQEGTTDGGGQIELKFPVHVRECQVFFPRQNVVHPVRMGDMDPIEEPSGVRKRLQHLGYQRALDDDDAVDITEDDVEAYDRLAILAFQKASGLPLTGEVDDATRAALLKAHGS